MPLTDAKIRSLKPKPKSYKVSDYDSLFLLITPKGSKLWKFKYRIGGKENRLAFGKYPYVTLQQAREKRDEARSLLEQGINPAEKRDNDKKNILAQSEHSFSKFAAQYIDKLIKEGKSEETLKKKNWLLGMAIADFGNTPINEIDAQTILATLKKREAKGHYETVGRLRSTIGAVFRFAVASGIAKEDPTYALKDALIKPTVKHRAAITDRPTLKRYLRALENYHGQPETQIALKFLILFASRPGEIRQARWDQFDIEKKVWSLDAEQMKMKRPHYVPLCQEALDLLERLKTHTGWGELLFPSQANSKKPISENTLNQALRRMGFGPDEVTSHGFRATFSTFANESGLWNPDAIEAYCARKDRNTVRGIYNRSLYWDERVKIAKWWSETLATFANRNE